MFSFRTSSRRKQKRPPEPSEKAAPQQPAVRRGWSAIRDASPLSARCEPVPACAPGLATSALFRPRLWPEPTVKVFAHEVVVVKVRIRGVNAIDFFALAGAQRFLRV